ncbi:MAG: hypothetical protein WDN44_15185 [Sphingomonas sp.]
MRLTEFSRKQPHRWNALRLARRATPQGARFVLLAALLAACFLTGGSSRADVPLLLTLRPLEVLVMTALLLLGPSDFVL